MLSATSGEEVAVQVVGREDVALEADQVHTIDVWFSARRRVWVVERVSVDGHHIGHAAHLATQDEARDCVADWLRTHTETVHVAPREPLLAGLSGEAKAATVARTPRRCAA